MDELEVRTEVHLPPTEVYEFLVDFERYARYSKYLREVERVGGDGDTVGAEYALRFGWWKVRYGVRSRVTDAVPAESIAFELTSGIRARGEWRIEDREDATAVEFHVRYDPDSVADDAVHLPAFVSLSWVIDRVEPMIEREARRVVERVVADLEGERRDVDIEVEWPDRRRERS